MTERMTSRADNKRSMAHETVAIQVLLARIAIALVASLIAGAPGFVVS